MSKKNRDYWRQRYSILKNNLLNRSDDYKIRLQEQYEKAQKEAEDRINIFYQRFATNNNITFNEAKKMLNSNERKKFQMTLNEYIKKGKANAVSNLWIKELENASNIYHIDRLKALQIEIRQQIELLSSSKEKGMTDLFSGIYEDSYYGGIYEIQKGFNYGKPFAQLDTRKINAALIRPYDSTGLSFSEKIWNDRKALVQYLDTDFARSIMRGANPQTLSEELAKKFKTSVKNANRILISESANIASLGSQACFNELGVEEFENLETLDGNTCEECQDMDKTHFPMKYFQIGLNAAPFHPNCRGVQVPYFNDEFTANEQRFARDENGRGYYVPADMSYKEWKKKYVANKDFDVNFSNYYKDGVKLYEENQIKEMAEQAYNIANKYTNNKSKWSGNIKIIPDTPENENTPAGKAWDCDILSKNETALHILIHEQLHAHSISYYTPIDFMRYRNIEEASVELLAKQICYTEGITPMDSGYDDLVDILLEINHKAELFDNDLKFAQELFNIKLDERSDWLRDKIISSPKVNISEINELTNMIEDNFEPKYKKGV